MRMSSLARVLLLITLCCLAPLAAAAAPPDPPAREFRAAPPGEEILSLQSHAGAWSARVTLGARPERFNLRPTRDDRAKATDYAFDRRDWILHLPDDPTPLDPVRIIDPVGGRHVLVEVTDAQTDHGPGDCCVNRRSAGNHSSAMIHFLLPRTPENLAKLAAFESEGTLDRPRHFTFDEAFGADAREVTMWTSREHAPELIERVRESLSVNPRLWHQLRTEGDSTDAPSLDTTGPRPLTTRLITFARELDALEATGSTVDPDATLIGLRDNLREVERLLKQARTVSNRLRQYSHAVIALDDVRRDFEDPLRTLMARGFDAIWNIGTHEATSLMLAWPQHFGFPQTYLNRSIPGRIGLFDAWALTIALQLGEAAHDHEPGGAWITQTYAALGRYRLNLVELPVVATDAVPTWPVFALGLENGADARAMLAALIRGGDRAAEKLRQRHGVDGSDDLARLLDAIARGASDSFAQNYAGFAMPPAPYLTQAAALFSELLEDARFTLNNRATYLLIVSNAYRLKREIEREYPPGFLRSTEDEAPARLAVQLNRLQNALLDEQDRQIQILTTGCEDKLVPRAADHK